MPKLLFDPVTYQFYYRCHPDAGGPARVAGFSWDPVRRRYYTLDPKVAAGLASRGDDYVRLLLADALETDVLHEHSQVGVGHRRMISSTQHISLASRTVH